MDWKTQCSMGVTSDEEMEIVYEDCVGCLLAYYDCFVQDFIEIPYGHPCGLLIRMGYSIEQITQNGETVFVVN